MHTISGLLSADDPEDYAGSIVFSIDRQGEAVVIVVAPLGGGETPPTLLITPDMPCHAFFVGVSDLGRGRATRCSVGTATDAVLYQVATGGSL